MIHWFHCKLQSFTLKQLSVYAVGAEFRIIIIIILDNDKFVDFFTISLCSLTISVPFLVCHTKILAEREYDITIVLYRTICKTLRLTHHFLIVLKNYIFLSDSVWIEKCWVNIVDQSDCARVTQDNVKKNFFFHKLRDSFERPV